MMPPFAATSGGMLTGQQVDALVQGMIHEWSRPAEFAGTALPPYAATAPGNPADGQKAYTTACARCHGADGAGIKAANSTTKDEQSPAPHSIVDSSYLALVNDQGLRSIVLAGHPDDDAPDWRGYIPGHPLAPQEITDIVAWLAAHRHLSQPPAPKPNPASPRRRNNDHRHTNPEQPRPSSLRTLPRRTVADRSRRAFLFKLSLHLNAAVGAVLAVPILGYLLGPAFKRDKDYKSWVALGPITDFPDGETRLADFRNPVTTFDDGETANVACWVRHISRPTVPGLRHQLRASRLPRPLVRRNRKLFICPCHGGAYYEDGSRASGPPERGLFEYHYSIVDGNLMIHAGDMPTLANAASCPRSRSSKSRPHHPTRHQRSPTWPA